MSKSDEYTIDEANYRKLQEPFPSVEEANKELQAFFDGVRELRNKHRITDVYVIVEGHALDSDGNEGSWRTSMHCGSELKSESLTAFAYGFESAKRQERIAGIVDHACKAIQKRQTRK